MACFLFTGITAYAQDPADDDMQPANQRRVNVLRQLGLSPAQLQQIRKINQGRRPAIQQAQDRVRMASRRLDEAIYADVPNEAEVQSRLKEFQMAQAEVSRIRFMNEFAIRSVLKPEQLGRFRMLRQQFALGAGDAPKWAAAPPAAAPKGNLRRMVRSGKRPF
jgi:Spy/CpxP family protein refolding chaperone